jgi:cell wall-associated NlpC family hydrolase
VTNAAASDVGIADLLLNGAGMKASITEAISTTALTQTITGASTLALAVSDPQLALLRSPWCEARTAVTLGDLSFELAAVAKASRLITLTFEDQAVSILRRHKAIVKAAKGTTSRVAFCRRLINMADKSIIVDGPDQGPTALEELSTGTSASLTTAPASSSTASSSTTIPATIHEFAVAVLKLIHAPTSQANLAFFAAWAHREGTTAGNNPLATSQNMPGSTSFNSVGVQNYPTPAVGAQATFKTLTNGNYNDIVDALRAGTASLTAHYPGLSTWSGGGYDNLAGEPTANLTLNATPTTSTADSSGQREDWWTGITRIMTAINWRVFARRGHVVIAPDSWLLNQPGITISEATDGIDSIDFDVDRGRPTATVTIACRADRWQVQPGEPVTTTDLGPGDDTYLCSQINRSLTSKTASVALTKKQKTLPEPGSSSGATVGDGGSAMAFIGKVAAQKLGQASEGVQKFVTFELQHVGDTYQWGGNGPHDWDCSGIVYAATAAAGHPIGARTADLQYRACLAAKTNMPVEQALKTCGALLFATGRDGGPPPYDIGHVATSLGNGRIFAAEGTTPGINVFPASIDPWTYAGLPPGFKFDVKDGK